MNVPKFAPLCIALLLSYPVTGCGAKTATTQPAPSTAGSGAPVGSVATPCVPDCDGKTCGFDGCFDQCGICAVGNTCQDGQCVAYACVPNCEGRTCGDDGCGGSCGTCAEGTFCLDAVGTCNTGETDECQGVTYDGCCDGEVATWCQDGQLVTDDCSQYSGSCGWVDGVGYYCESDGGLDPDGLPKDCDLGTSPPPDCTPNCTGIACGSDGCGGSCGTCPSGQSCSDGTCVAGGGCGEITYDGCCDGEVATYCVDGQLVSDDCSGDPLCGWIDGTGYYCGSDGGIDPGGLPKECPGGDPTPDPCADLGEEGCCKGPTVNWCEGGQLQEMSCSGGDVCGWNADKEEYECGSEGGADPSGTNPKACP